MRRPPLLTKNFSSNPSRLDLYQERRLGRLIREAAQSSEVSGIDESLSLVVGAENLRDSDGLAQGALGGGELAGALAGDAAGAVVVELCVEHIVERLVGAAGPVGPAVGADDVADVGVLEDGAGHAAPGATEGGLALERGRAADAAVVDDVVAGVGGRGAAVGGDGARADDAQVDVLEPGGRGRAEDEVDGAVDGALGV